jgi:hypothetical protein
MVHKIAPLRLTADFKQRCGSQSEPSLGLALSAALRPPIPGNDQGRDNRCRGGTGCDKLACCQIREIDFRYTQFHKKLSGVINGSF